MVLSDLAVTPISETIRTCAEAGRSGDLHVRSGRLAKLVSFDRGRIVFAASNVRSERLGEALVKAGAITKDEFARASGLMKRDRKTRFGDALVQAGVMTRDEVGRAIVQWVEHILLSLFRLKSGAVSFDERRCPIPRDYLVDLPAERILRGGIQQMTDGDLVMAGLGDLDRLVIRAPSCPSTAECSAEEQRILEQARKPVTIGDLASSERGPDFERCRAVYALLAGGLIRGAHEAPAAGDPEADAFRQEIADELRRSESLDLQSWLGVPVDAASDDVERAVGERLLRYQALYDAPGVDDDLKTDIELLRSRASSARFLAARRNAPEAPATPTAPVTPAVPEPPTHAAPVAAPAPTAGMEMEHLLMEASVRLSVGDYSEAARSYARLVEIEPNNAGYRMRLAVAMAHCPATARQAERQFEEAIRLEPDNVDFHFRFGVYYKAMKVHSRSISEFRNVVRLDPRHEKALAELEALAPRDSVFKGFKKLIS